MCPASLRAWPRWEQTDGVARNLPERRGERSLASKADDVLLVLVVGAVLFGALQLVGWVIGTIAFLLKVGVVLALVAVGVAWALRR